MAQTVKNPPAMWKTWAQSLDWEDPLEKGMATHSSILVWRIPWTVLSHGVTRSGIQPSDFHFHTGAFGFTWWLNGKECTCNARDMSVVSGSGRSPGEGNDNPLHYSCLGNPMDRGSCWATVHAFAESDMTEVT